VIVEVYPHESINRPAPTHTNILRIEIPLEAQLGLQFKITVLDAADSTDVIITNPDGTREAVWSLAKDTP